MGMSVEFTDLVYDVPPKKKGHSPLRILHGVSASVGVGESMAILGPSGSGKTSLLNLLAGRSMYTQTSGNILFDGQDRTTRTKRRIGYVMQDDLFFSQLTVRQTLQFTADVRLGRGAGSREEKSRRIDHILKALRLTRAQHTHIGDQSFHKGISGGERKRLNIANELLPDPPLLLGDECTSGLDSSSAYTVVQLLKSLSHQGKTVICTIHQPSSQMFYLFDKVLLLSSGKVAYFGTPKAAPAYFASIGYPFPSDSYNPADAMLELVIDDIPETDEAEDIVREDDRNFPDVEAVLTSNQLAKKHILERWEQRDGAPFTEHARQTIIPDKVHGNKDCVQSSSNESEGNTPSVTMGLSDTDRKSGLIRALQKRWWGATRQKSKDCFPQKYSTTFWEQFCALGRRSMLQKRGILLERTHLGQIIAVAVVCVIFWWRIKRVEDTIDDRVGSFFFSIVFWAFISVNQALFTFPAERAVLNKDRASGSYRLSAYFLAKCAVEIPTDMLHPLLFILITYFGMNLNPTPEAFFLHTIAMLLTVITSLSMGMLISAVVIDVKDGQPLSTVLILFSMLLSGFYIKSENIPPFIRRLTPLSFLKFSYEALLRIEAKGQLFTCVQNGDPHSIYSNNGRSCPVDDKALLKAAQVDANFNVFTNLLVLVAWTVVTRLLAYFALKYLNRHHKPAKRQSHFKKKKSRLSNFPRQTEGIILA